MTVAELIEELNNYPHDYEVETVFDNTYGPISDTAVHHIDQVVVIF